MQPEIASDICMTYLAESIHFCFDCWSFTKFVNRMLSASVFLIHNSLSRLPFRVHCLQFPSITQHNSLSPCPQPPQPSLPMPYGPFFPVGSLPNESVSHSLRCSMYPPLPPPQGYSKGSYKLLARQVSLLFAKQAHLISWVMACHNKGRLYLFPRCSLLHLQQKRNSTDSHMQRDEGCVLSHIHANEMKEVGRTNSQQYISQEKQTADRENDASDRELISDCREHNMTYVNVYISKRNLQSN